MKTCVSNKSAFSAGLRVAQDRVNSTIKGVRPYNDSPFILPFHNLTFAHYRLIFTPFRCFLKPQLKRLDVCVLGTSIFQLALMICSIFNRVLFIFDALIDFSPSDFSSLHDRSYCIKPISPVSSPIPQLSSVPFRRFCALCSSLKGLAHAP